MSITLAGILVTFSGIGVVLAAIIVLPSEIGSFKTVALIIGWIFIVIGVIIRAYGMKLKRKQKI